MICDDLCHRLPDVAAARTRLTAEERRHVDECPECRRELKLLALTARLGDGLETVRRPEATAGRVTARLAVASTRRQRVLAVVGLATAAAVFLAIRVTLPPGDPNAAPAAASPVGSTPISADDRVPLDSIRVERGTVPAPVRPLDPAPARIALPELDGMAEGELEIVLDQLDRLLDDPLVEEDAYPAADAELGSMLTEGEA